MLVPLVEADRRELREGISSECCGRDVCLMCVGAAAVYDIDGAGKR